MKRSTRVLRRPSRARPPTSRIAAAIIATGALVVLAAACSSPSSAGGSPAAAGSATSSSAVAYSHCMRSHGEPTFADPPSSGLVPKADPQELGVSSSQLQAAQRACQHLYPTNGGALGASLRQCEETGDCPQAMVQRVVSDMRLLARCMRSHGVPNFPDPTNGGSGGPVFNITKAGISDAASHTSQFGAKLTECGRLVGGNAPESFE